MQCRFPLLRLVAKLVYTPPVASIESERIFSCAGFIRNKNRSRLEPRNLEMMLKVGYFLRQEDAPIE